MAIVRMGEGERSGSSSGSSSSSSSSSGSKDLTLMAQLRHPTELLSTSEKSNAGAGRRRHSSAGTQSSVPVPLTPPRYGRLGWG